MCFYRGVEEAINFKYTYNFTVIYLYFTDKFILKVYFIDFIVFFNGCFEMKLYIYTVDSFKLKCLIYEKNYPPLSF